MSDTTVRKREAVKQFNFCLPPSMVTRLDEIAERNLSSRSTILRQIIAKHLDGRTTEVQTDAER